VNRSLRAWRPARAAARTALLAAVALSVSAVSAFAAFNQAATGGPMSVTTTSLTAPTGLAASNPCSSATAVSTSLSWTASTSTATTGYAILRSSASAGPFSSVGTVSGINTTTYTDTVSHATAADSIYVAVKSANGMDVVSMASNSKTANSGGANMSSPTNIAVTPDGTKAYVANSATIGGNETVTPITLSNDTAGTPITVGGSKAPVGIAITPDGTTAWVGTGGTKTLVPITVATNTAGTAVSFTFGVNAVAITPDGTHAWATGAGGAIESMNTSTHALGTTINAVNGGTSGNMQAIAISPDGTKAYITDASTNKMVWPVTLSGASGTLGTPISLTFAPQAIAISPDGSTAWVAGATDIVPITGLPGSPVVGTLIPVTGAAFQGIAISPNGCFVYAADASANHQVVAVNAVTKAESTISLSTDVAEDIATAYPPVTYYYEVEGTRNVWTSPASGQASHAFGQPAQSS